MISSVQSSAISPYMPFTLANPSQILKNAQKITPIAIAILAAASIPGVDGGPFAEIACMGICTAAAYATAVGAIWFPLCMEHCVLWGFAPTP